MFKKQFGLFFLNYSVLYQSNIHSWTELNGSENISANTSFLATLHTIFTIVLHKILYMSFVVRLKLWQAEGIFCSDRQAHNYSFYLSEYIAHCRMMSHNRGTFFVLNCTLFFLLFKNYHCMETHYYFVLRFVSFNLQWFLFFCTSILL